MLKRGLPAGLIAVAMALALAGGAVLAVGRGTGPAQADIFERAAAILGIETSELQAAHDQASREAQDEKLVELVENLVENELITQEEADSFTAWITTRPTSANELFVRQVTSGLSGHLELRPLRTHRSEFPDDITDRMAEILGIAPSTLDEALSEGSQEAAQSDRLAKLHAIVDSMEEKGSITSDEADELHAWVDKTPQWILELDISSRILPAFDLFDGDFGDRDFFRRLPFGKFDHFGEGDHEFRFEFNGPEGSFRFAPGDGELPFTPERFEGLDDLFEQFEELEGIEGLFEEFRGHRFFESPFEELIPDSPTPDTASAA